MAEDHPNLKEITHQKLASMAISLQSASIAEDLSRGF
jgi:hypothetical protein